MDEEMLTAMQAAPAGDPMQETDADESEDADGELTPELRMFAKELGFETPAKALALKNFVHACMQEADDGAYGDMG